MKGCRLTLLKSAVIAACIFVLAFVTRVEAGDQQDTGRQGQRGEGVSGRVVNFSDLVAAEQHSDKTPKPQRSVRPRPRSGRDVQRSIPFEISAAGTTEAVVAEEPLFAPASGPASPAPALSFPGVLDNATSFNPDTQGAVGTNRVVTMTSSEVRIHTRQGAPISTVSLGTFWGASNVFDPRILYDPFAHRWVASATANPSGANRSLLVGVSLTSDPGGAWNLRSLPAGIDGDVFLDGPNMGLTKDWITIQLNTFDLTNYYYFSSEIRAFNKALLYSGGNAQFTLFRDTNAVNEANAAVPAVNFDNSFATNFLVANWWGNAVGVGLLRIYSISGPVGGEVFNDYGSNGLYVIGSGTFNPPWDDFAPTNDINFAPQQGTANKIYIGDARIQNLVYRDATLWCTHHVFLPVTAGATIPTRTAVQWWALTTGGNVLQRGRVDDATGGKSFAYPSIAVNQYEDVLIGYTRFAANQFPSANYSYRGFEDAFSTMRGDAVLKAGEASFFVDDGTGRNAWGDWSATVVDPINDADLWTVQQYASSPVAGSDRWGTWWGQFGPGTSLSVTASDSPDPVVAGGNVTYTIRVTNNFAVVATGAKAICTLPAGAAFVSAVASQGSCTASNGIVTCVFGDVIEEGAATATVVARLNQSGQATAAVVVSGNGPEESPANNSIQVVTTVNPASDVAVSVVGAPDPVTLNSTLTYAVVVTNLGPSSATGVSLTNTLPPGVTFLSANSAQGTCSQSAGVVRCTIGTVTAGSSVNVSIAVRPLSSGMLTNRVQVGWSGLDPNMANNTAVAVTKANAAPTLQTISDRTINEDAVLGPITFTVGDTETAASSLVVTAHSSDQAIVPNANISLATVAGSGGTNRTITVTPVANASGVVLITRSVTDQDGVSTSNQFQLTIQAVNDPPVISDITDTTVNEDSVLGPITFTVGDIETAAGTLMVSGASLNTTLIPNGNIQIGPPGSATRTVTIIPATNQTGTAVIRITVSDGTLTTNDTFSVTVNPVNDLPTISDIGNRTINEDGSTGPISFTVGDVETAAGSLSPGGTSSNPTLIPHANITFGGSGANRTVAVRPATNEFGSATITVTITDGDGGSTNDTFLVTVNPVNDLPTVSVPASLSINEDAGLQSLSLTNISGGPTNEPQTIEVTASSDNPALIPNPISINYASPAATGTLSFTPVANSNGTAMITVTVRDGGGSNNIVTRSITVDVAAVNDAPTVSDILDRTINEDASTGPISFQVGDIDSPLASVSVFGLSSDTNLVPHAGIVTGGTGATRSVNITPATNRFGSATITVVVTDGASTNTDTFVLTVLPVNDAPTISAIANRSIDEDSPGSAAFTVEDAETPAAELTLLASTTNPALFPNLTFAGSGANRTINLIPATNQAGAASVTVTVIDGNSSSNSVTFVVDVLPVNDPPTLARPGDLTIDEDSAAQAVVLTGIGTGAPNESQPLSIQAQSSDPALVPHPAVSYTNGNSIAVLVLQTLTNASGSAVIAVSISDGVATNTQSFTVTVRPINDPPYVAEVGTQEMDEDSTLTIPIHVADAETAPEQLIIRVTSSNLELLDDSGIELSGTGTNRTLRLTPFPDESDTSTFITIEVTDASNEMASTSFELHVRAVNDLPVLGGLSDRLINRSSTATVLNVPFTVSDPETLPLNLIVTASSSNPSLVPGSGLSVTGSGTFRTLTVTVTADTFGTAAITLIAKDGPQPDAGSATNSFVLRVNDLPTVGSLGPRTMNGNSTSNFAFTVADSETPAGALNVFASSSNQGLVPDSALQLSGTGAARTLAVTPNFLQFGTCNIGIRVVDADGGASTNTFVLTILPVDLSPIISNVPDTNMVEDSTLAVPFTIGDVENPPSLLTLKALSSDPALLPLSGMVFGGSESNRMIALTPAANRFGSVTVTISVTDTNGGVTIDEFVLTVNPTNDLPTLSSLPNLTIDEDSSTGPLSIVVGDVETSATNLALTAVSGNTTLVPSANIVPSGSGSHRTLAITPLPNQFGSSVITVRVADNNGGSNSINFTLTVNAVNDPPTLSAISDLAIAEDSGLRSVALSGLSAGPGETQSLSFAVQSGNTNVIPSGAVSYTNGSSTAVLNFTPAANATGSSLLTVQVSDGGASNQLASRSFLVAVTNINDAPTISDIASQQTIEDVPLTVPFTIGDRETSPLSLTVSATSTNTSLVANTNILVNGSGTNRSLTIVPSPNASGTTLITVSVSDGSTNATDSFLLTVTATNDPPTLDFISNTNVIAMGGNQTYTINLTGISSGAANESQSLTISATASPSMNTAPTAAISGSGPTGTVTLRPGNSVQGTWQITVTVSDGQASVVRTFSFSARASGNVPPFISTIGNQTISEDSVISALPFTVRDATTPAASLVVTAVSTNETLVPTNNIVFGGSGTNRTITITPAANQFGTTAIRLTVRDSENGSSNMTFNVTVNAVNDPPVIQPIANQSTVEDTTSAPIQIFVTDAESPAGTLAVTATSGNQTLVPNGNILVGGSGTNRALIVTPAVNQSGSAVITVNVSDGTASTNAQFTLQVNPVNDAPTIADVADQSINEDGAPAVIPLVVGDLETPAGNLSLTVSSSNANLVPLTLDLGGSGANRTLTVTPGPNLFGETIITVSVSDGTNQTADTFLLRINPVNDPPTLGLIADQTVVINSSAVSVNLAGIGSGATNESQTLFVTVSSSEPSVIPHPTVTYISPGTTGSLSLAPVRDAVGSAVITVIVNDAQTQSNIVTRMFTVTVIDSGPELRIEHLGGMAVVSWATNNADGWVLQSTGDVMDPNGWYVVATSPVAIEGRFTVTNAPGSVMQVYRLCRNCGPGNQPAAPVLVVNRSGGQVSLRWPAMAGNFVLEEADQLAQPVNWRIVTATPTLVGGQLTVMVNSVERKFYRLRNQ